MPQIKPAKVASGILRGKIRVSAVSLKRIRNKYDVKVSINKAADNDI